MVWDGDGGAHKTKVLYDFTLKKIIRKKTISIYVRVVFGKIQTLLFKTVL